MANGSIPTTSAASVHLPLYWDTYCFWGTPHVSGAPLTELGDMVHIVGALITLLARPPHNLPTPRIVTRKN